MQYRYVWADGELLIGSAYSRLHHRSLLKELIDSGRVKIPVQNYVAGNFSTDDFHGPAYDHIDVVWESGKRPSVDELRYMIQQELQRTDRLSRYAASVEKNINRVLDYITAEKKNVEDTEPAGKNVGFMRAPHKVLYPNLFQGKDKISPEYANKIKDNVLNSIKTEFKDPDSFIYFTIYGDGLSYNWSEGGDLDVQMWVDIEKYNKSGNPDKTIDDLIADIRRLVQLVNFPSFKELGMEANKDEVEPTTGSMLVQYYPKPGTGSKDENLASNPYACYDLEKGEWLYHPKPITPLDYVENFKRLMPKAKDIAMQTESLLGEYQRNILNWQFWFAMYQRYHEPYFKEQYTQSMKDATQQKEGIKTLFEGVFGGRAEAYAPGGHGIYDERDNLQKLLEVWDIFQELKHYARAPLPWEEQELPADDSLSEDKQKSKQDADNQSDSKDSQDSKKKSKNAHGTSVSGWSREVKSGWKMGVLQNLPEKAMGPNPHIQQAAQSYAQKLPFDYNPPQEYIPVDPNRATSIAQEYDTMQHKPNDPAVKASYDAFKKETLDQYNHLVNQGYRFEFYPGYDPYPKGPRQALEDLAQNKHLYVYPTSAGFGTNDTQSDHPLLEDSGVHWNGRPVTYNDIFRAVHDVFGHAKEGVGFRADGEDNAWRQHAAMYSDLAKPAMTAETRGQNSWVNFGPHGEHNQTANQADTIYADQKAGLLPDWVHSSSVKQATFEDIVADILSNGGGTYDTADLDPAGQKYGYYVSIKDQGLTVPVDKFNGEILSNYLKYMSTDLLGAWVFNDEVYLDSTKWFADLDEALEFGRQNDQMAIWDIANQTEVFVNEPRTSGAEDSPEHRDPGGWPGIMEKAQRLRDNGQVQITLNEQNHVVGTVRGDHGVYQTEIWRDDPNSGTITLWNCDCPWSDYSWGRTRQWRKYEGRPCSHTLALYWTALATPVQDENQMTIPGTTPEQAPPPPGGVNLPNALQQTVQQPQPTQPQKRQTPPGSKPQPATQSDQMTIGFPGAFSRWRKEGQFLNGDYVRVNTRVDGHDDRGEYYVVPRNMIGEVIWSDDQETIAIFSINAGPLGPHNVKVVAPTEAFNLVPRQKGTAPRRRR